jgi:acid phosphatase
VSVIAEWCRIDRKACIAWSSATRFRDPGDTRDVRPRTLALALLSIMAVVSVSAVLIASNSFGADRDDTPPIAPVQGPPALGHVWLIVLENKSFDAIIGSPDAPYLNELAAASGLATRYVAVATPSQPNYIALFSGSTQRVLDNDRHDIKAPNLADQLEAAGRTWRVYAENLPPDCSQAETWVDGPDAPDGAGTYARKHEPAISFSSIARDDERCLNIQPLAAFDPAAADFSLIIPNMCHDMHDCGVAAGDAWLRTFVPRITGSAAWHDGGTLFVTFDEGVASTTPPNRIATIVSSPLVPAGTTSDVPHDHYSLLRTVQNAFGLDCLEDSCSANTLGEFFSKSP